MEKIINIYLLNIEKIKKNEDYIISFLPKERIEKANKYIKKEDYYLSIGGSYLIEKFVGKGKYFYTEEGKPYKESRHFSLSHSHDYVALALGESAIGLDIEKIRDFKKELIPYIANEEETKTIKTKEDFFLHWCLKESLLKCVGSGIKNSLKPIPAKIEIFEFNEDMYSSNAMIYKNYQIALTIKYEEKISLNVIEL